LASERAAAPATPTQTQLRAKLRHLDSSTSDAANDDADRDLMFDESMESPVRLDELRQED
jgi:hypothetical protein